MLTMQLPLLILLTGSCAFAAFSQNNLNDIAKNLEIKVELVENLDDGSQHKFNISFDNKGNTTLPNTNWTIYFYSFFIVEPKHLFTEDNLSTKPEGYILPGANVRLSHVNGGLFTMSPAEGFQQLHPNTKRNIIFFAENWAVSKTDIPPNWYITMPGLEPRVFQCTINNFVADFSTEKQWKRMKKDRYNPYSAEDRYFRYKSTNSNSKRKIVIPTPKEIHVYDDSLTLDTTGSVRINAGEFVNEASYLLNKTGFRLIGDSVDVVIRLERNNELIEDSYTLRITPNEGLVLIKAKTGSGIFYGIQTLISLSANDKRLPKIEITDMPRFGFRGMHVDIARNFIPKNALLRLLDTMAMYKMNKLHLHLSDDEGWRLEIPGLPELTEVGSKRCHSLTEDSCLIPQLGSGPDRTTSGSGYLTYVDYVELLKYAKARHVEVIPEIDMPGHARAAIRSMEARYRKLMKLGQEEQAKKFRLFDPLDDSRYLSVQYFNDNAMNPCLESTFTFVKHVVFEIFKMHMSANYPLNKVHFGGDEVAKTAWINSTTCNNIPLNVDKRAYMKKYFVQRVSKLAEHFGVDLIEWEDGLMDTDGKPFPRATFENTEIYSNAWDNVWEWGAADRAYNLANAGYKVIMSHATHLYFDHPYEPDPEERGLYWAPRFTDTMKTFGFLPDNLYENIDVTRMGEPLNRTTVCGPDNIKCPALQNRSNIAGMQGHLWSETVLSEDDFYYMVFPRLLALAERAWHKAPWETSLNKTARNTMIKEDWDSFALTVGSKELKRLDEAGIKYRVPPPGARKSGLLLETNTAYHGLIVEHSTDGNTWKTGNITGLTGAILLRTRSADGQHFSRVVTYTEPTVTKVTTTTSPNKEKKDKINKGHKGRGKGHGLYKSKNHEDKKDKKIKGYEEPKRGHKSKKSKSKGHNGHPLPGHGREKSKGKGRN